MIAQGVLPFRKEMVDFGNLPLLTFIVAWIYIFGGIEPMEFDRYILRLKSLWEYVREPEALSPS